MVLALWALSVKLHYIYLLNSIIYTSAINICKIYFYSICSSQGESYFITNTLIHRSGTSWKTDLKFNTTDSAGTLTHSHIVLGIFFHLGTNSHQQNERQRYSQPDNLTLTWTKVFSKLPTVQYTTIKHAAILIHQSSIPSCVSMFPPSINYKLKTKITRSVQNSSLVTQ